MYQFALNTWRQITDAVELTYNNGALHPNRDKPTFHDFVYMTEGFWDFTLDGVTYDVCPGDVFILPAGTVYTGVSPCTPGTKNTFIHTTFAEGDRRCGAAEKGGASSIRLNPVIHCQNDPMVKDLFDEIQLTHASDMAQKEQIQSVLFQALLCYLYRCDRKTIVRNHDIVDESLAILKQSPHMFYKESEIAAMLFVSVKTLRNGFKKRYNKTFYRYQIDYKLEQAFLMLVNHPDIKVYEVAYELGFCDEFHLSKAFKNKFGISPNSCKKKYHPSSEKEQSTEEDSVE